MAKKNGNNGGESVAAPAATASVIPANMPDLYLPDCRPCKLKGMPDDGSEVYGYVYELPGLRAKAFYGVTAQEGWKKFMDFYGVISTDHAPTVVAITEPEPDPATEGEVQV